MWMSADRFTRGLKRCFHSHTYLKYVQKVNPEVFSISKRGNFFQEQPILSNPFDWDKFLQRCMQRVLPENVWRELQEDLHSFGNRICTQINDLGRMAELEPPRLRQFDAWGNRVDELITSQAWKDLHSISAEEGLVALGYERKHQQWSRLHQMSKLYIFAPSSGLYSCPIAMTDGAAKLIESSGNDFLKQQVFPRLISRTSAEFWTSGQWMTERQGGSDVGGTSTIAKGPLSNNYYKLYGYKWFTSAADAQIAFTLAKTLDKDGLLTTKDTKGLSLFYLLTLKDGHHNNFEIQKLKNKLGTRQLPTAEILLEGTEAYLLGKEGHGISTISSMLNITRLHNSVAAVGNMRRMMQLCADYSTRRVTFGKSLCQHPLHMQTLSRMEVLTRGCTVFLLDICKLLGDVECSSPPTSKELLLRILIPLLKLYTAKQAIYLASEGLESFGGQGYIEDTGLPTLLRDAQVLSIWEGTTNIISLDVIRVILKSKAEALKYFSETVHTYLQEKNDKDLDACIKTIEKQLQYSHDFIEKAAQENNISLLNTASRDLSFSLAHIYIGSLLIYHATKENSTKSDRNTAIRWTGLPFVLKEYQSYNSEQYFQDTNIVMNTGF